MKLKDVDLTRTHYVVVINTITNNILVTKTKYSTIEKSKYHTVADQFFIYPQLQDRDTYVDTPIVSILANPEEIIFEGGHYIKFNQQYKYQLNYIAFDIATMAQLIRDYFKEKYNTVKRKEGTIYRKNYSKDIQEMYKQYMKQIKKYLI